MNLIISASLSEIPTDSLAFRHVTLESHINLSMDCLIETEQELKDAYYKYLLNRGLLDWIEAIITPSEKERGIRIDSQGKPHIQVNSITFDNYIQILDQVRNYHGLCSASRSCTDILLTENEAS